MMHHSNFCKLEICGILIPPADRPKQVGHFRVTLGLCMGFSLPRLELLPQLQGDSAGMPNPAAVRCWQAGSNVK